MKHHGFISLFLLYAITSQSYAHKKYEETDIDFKDKIKSWGYSDTMKDCEEDKNEQETNSSLAKGYHILSKYSLLSALECHFADMQACAHNGMARALASLIPAQNERETLIDENWSYIHRAPHTSKSRFYEFVDPAEEKVFETQFPSSNKNFKVLANEYLLKR